MSSPVDHVGQLDRALAGTETLVAAVGDGQWSTRTGGPDWDARDLLNHVVGGNLTVSALLTGHDPPDQTRDLLAGDPLGAYRASGGALRAAFSQTGALERKITLPAGTVPGAVALHLRLTELLVHGWDLAHATDQRCAGLPPALAEQALAFSRAQLARMPAGRRPFGPSQPVDDAAPAVDRLAALLGRVVHRGAP